MTKVFTYYELQGTNPNLLVKCVNLGQALWNCNELKDQCKTLLLVEYQLYEEDGYLLSPDITVIRQYREGKLI